MTFLFFELLNKSAVHTGRPGLQPLPPGATTTLGHSIGGCGGPVATSLTGVEIGMKGLVVGRKGFSLSEGLTGERGAAGWCPSLRHTSWTFFKEKGSFGHPCVMNGKGLVSVGD